ncbi:M15 family metallopeptidase [Phreatobacter stygius]|uniref:M15 family metallopeptidase n=2 Tax=Phreatobacter stygius TaxID=1940610 RepID=A0A4D7B7C9_9HYPH|nr:M15 family metallopeptidase [Phreatobacter stygius]
MPLAGAAPAAATVSADRLAKLVASYPDHLAAVVDDILVWRDGTRMTIGSDRPARAFEDMVRSATIADQLRQTYQPGPPQDRPARDESPGRLRNTAFFVKMYGDCAKGGVTRLMRPVAWMPKTASQTIQLTNVNDVAARMERVIDLLDRLPDRLKAFLVPSAGTYNCRVVADTGVPSMHAYGAAIDIHVGQSDYWAWASRRGEIAYRNRIPFEIVAIFEAEGFIWGGKWYHFDTMHFEYRPEMFG